MPNYNVKINLGDLKTVYSLEDDSSSVILKFDYFYREFEERFNELHQSCRILLVAQNSQTIKTKTFQSNIHLLPL